jgi:hypothetical protein
LQLCIEDDGEIRATGPDRCFDFERLGKSTLDLAARLDRLQPDAPHAADAQRDAEILQPMVGRIEINGTQLAVTRLPSARPSLRARAKILAAGSSGRIFSSISGKGSSFSTTPSLRANRRKDDPAGRGGQWTKHRR